MQPQGHVQVLLNLLAFRMSPQEALDAPRVCLGSSFPGVNGPGVEVHVEPGIQAGEAVLEGLRKLGYDAVLTGLETEDGGVARNIFGIGQVVRVNEYAEGRVWSGASDMRGDGHCVGF